jgi:hypothetical protein
MHLPFVVPAAPAIRLALPHHHLGHGLVVVLVGDADGDGLLAAGVAAQHHAIVRDMKARLRRYLDAGEDLTNGSFGLAGEG